jgi:hypothetical protein
VGRETGNAEAPVSDRGSSSTSSVRPAASTSRGALALASCTRRLASRSSVAGSRLAALDNGGADCSCCRKDGGQMGDASPRASGFRASGFRAIAAQIRPPAPLAAPDADAGQVYRLIRGGSDNCREWLRLRVAPPHESTHASGTDAPHVISSAIKALIAHLITRVGRSPLLAHDMRNEFAEMFQPVSRVAR